MFDYPREAASLAQYKVSVQPAPNVMEGFGSFTELSPSSPQQADVHRTSAFRIVQIPLYLKKAPARAATHRGAFLKTAAEKKVL